MKNLLFMVLMTIFITACQKKSQLCDLPLDSTPAWMENIIGASQESGLSSFFYFETAELDHRQVFILQNCCPNCGTIVQVFNCSGEVIGILGDDIALKELDNIRLFYTPENFQCNVATGKSPQ